jgi:purine catabolism regulator
MTLARLRQEAALRLRVLAGHDLLDRPVGWVHVSELDDPTPFLEGGELLLTTGLRVDAGTDFRAFVARLVDRGVAGLGFGTGLGHDAVPPALVTAADEAGLPLLEVPKRTPFIAISKAVSAAVAADSYAEVTATNAAQRELTAAALAGPERVVRRLSRLLGGWVLLLERSGTALAASPATAVHRVAELSVELDRLHRRVASAGFALGEDHVAVHVLGNRGFLVVGRPSPLDRVGQQVLTAAASVLTLTIARAGDLDTARRRLRGAGLRLLSAGHPELAAEVSPLPGGPVEVHVFTGPVGHRARGLELLESRDVFCADLDGRLVAVGPGVEALAGLRGGVSEPADHADFGRAHRQAVRAADSAHPGDLVRFGDLAGVGMLGLLNVEDAHAYAESLLRPVLEHDRTGRGDLVVSLGEWLRRHGQWDPAAARLGVHRHTLRNRIGKIAELTGRDLDSPGARAEFWFALQLLDQAANGPGDLPETRV